MAAQTWLRWSSRAAYPCGPGCCASFEVVAMLERDF